MSDSVVTLQTQVNHLREHQQKNTTDIAVMAANYEHLQESVDKIEANLGRVVWAVLAGVIVAVLNLVL